MGFDKGTPEVPWQTWGLRYKRAGSPRTDNYELLHCPRTASRTMPPSGNRLARDRTGQPELGQPFHCARSRRPKCLRSHSNARS
jgi:hypothetical protein